MNRARQWFETHWFKLRPVSALLFAFIWLVVGFSTGVSTLLGPVRWVTSYMRETGIAGEGAAVKLIILGYVSATALVSLWQCRIILRTGWKHIRYGLPMIWMICAGASLWLMLSPAHLQLDRGADDIATARFTFGAYPDAAKLRQLKAEGYTAVIPLLHPAVVPFEPILLADEQAAAEKIGIDIIHIPMLPWIGKNKAALDRFRKLAESGRGRYYVHCYLGKDRVRMVRRVIIAAGDVELEDDGIRGRSIFSVKRFERGEIHQLDIGVYLTPFPTDDEFLGKIIASEIVQVVSLLDPEDEQDRQWIDREEKILGEYTIPLLSLPIPKAGLSARQLKEYVRQVSALPRPVIVHAFLTSGNRAVTFKDSYQTISANAPVPADDAETAVTAFPDTGLAAADTTAMNRLPGGFLQRAVPDIRLIILLTPGILIYTLLAAGFAGWLRAARKVRVPYTRKVFHFLIFTSAGIIQINAGLAAVNIFGVIVSSAVLYALYRGDGFPFYEAMARPTDAPRRSLFIFIPLVMTALGGLLSNIWFAPYAFIGYLVGGWGDAVGEPVGSRWGRHQYKVRSLGGVPATRSIEGSAAVALMSIAAAGIGLASFGIDPLTAVKVGVLCGLGGAVVEAFSNHGLDNLTMQVAASAIAWMMLA